LLLRTGGTTIGEVLRRAWDRLIHKQWLILYPLLLAVINTLAFLAIYTATSETVGWNSFFVADFDRWQFLKDHFITRLTLTPALGVAVFEGLAVCAFSAFIRAPYFRAIAGPSYPITPRSRIEAGRLAIFYLFANLIIWIMPLATPGNTAGSELIAVTVLVVSILLVFADYVIVFEGLPFLSAIRRSIRLLVRRWGAVIVVFVLLHLVYLGLYRLYDLYYQNASGVSLILPLSQILVESLLVLAIDLVLISLYQQIRWQR
jgi:hypothetical protein